jgi:hypothetical protein
MRTFIQDLRYGLRLLARSPGFTAIALLTLTLGIGATAAIFSVVDAVLLRALPYREPQRLVSVFEDISEEGFPRNTPAPGNYADWKAQTQIFEDAAAAAEDGRFHVFNLTGDRAQRRRSGEIAGRVRHPEPVLRAGREARAGPRIPARRRPAGGPRVVLMSHGIVEAPLSAGDPGTGGRAIVLNGEKYTVLA